mmetsp:Transcript_26977/g.34372  ORF Transcript_26977/g.34372 Transcript_26977/m.34372 type:complete len:84 (+) Transcript_26977:1284-1535(+)
MCAAKVWHPSQLLRQVVIQWHQKRAWLTGSEIVLEQLGRTTKNSAAGKSPSNTRGSSVKPSGNNGGRTLFDPTRTYSSLVGGR